MGPWGPCSRASAPEEDRQARNDSGLLLLVPRLLTPQLRKTVEISSQQGTRPRNHSNCRTGAFNQHSESMDFIQRFLVLLGPFILQCRGWEGLRCISKEGQEPGGSQELHTLLLRRS